MVSIKQNIKYTYWEMFKAVLYRIGLYKKCPLCGTDTFAFNGEYCKRIGCKHNLEEI